MTDRPRWFTEHDEQHSAGYIARFRKMAAEGKDLVGEARLLDVLVGRGSRILDAGCGPGRIAGELHARGHDVVGVDVDPTLIEAAALDHPGPRWEIADLTDLDLGATPFDAAVLAGNVLLYVAPGSERRVLARVAAHVRPDGVIVTGFATGRPYGVADFDADIAATGLVLEHRFATWDLRPWHDDASWVVSILRVPV